MAKVKRKPSGPKAKRLAIKGNWRDALAHALKQGKPTPAKKEK